jgi:hypothetical protein
VSAFFLAPRQMYVVRYFRQFVSSPSLVLVKGALKTNPTDPYVVGWFLGGQKSTRVGWIFFRDFLSCFLTPLTEKRPKKRDKKVEKKSVLDFSTFVKKTFRHDLFCKTFFVVLLNSHR